MAQPNRTRVLIAEDSPRMRHILYKLLELMGYVVVGQAIHGRQAVEMTEALHPDVVITDISMPDMDGIEAAQLIQERCPTPVVVITAHASHDLVDRASKVGVGAYLVKPPREEELARAITIAIARFQDMMELRRLNAELQKALEKVKMLSGLLPICAGCKKIRNDKGYWERVEDYIKAHSRDVDFSHGICPDCLKKYFPEVYKRNLKKAI